jgi:ribosomal protein L31
MKNGIHPDYRPVVFRFYTGRKRLVDTAGRVEKFNQRYSRGT